jgi:F-type H+-transporting ATPase subunit gamma
MASLQDIRRRIRSVKNTQQVTKAMKMISAVKLRKSQERLIAMRPFATTLHDLIGQVAARFGPDAEFAENSLAHAFLSPRPESNVHVVIIASDKGLCGGFNANLLKAAEAFFNDDQDQAAQYYMDTTGPSGLSMGGKDFLTGLRAARLSRKATSPMIVASRQAPTHKVSTERLGTGCMDVIGRRAAEWARKVGIKPSFEAISLVPGDYMETAREIAQRAIQGYESGEIDALYVVYNNFNSAVSQTPRIARIFPPMEIPRATGVWHLLEPDPHTVLNELLPHFVETEICRTLLESAASEHAARMAAMDKATSNAYEMIDKLTLHMNKVRQAAITNQIIEVVSGAAS